jgi:hypothetical protein
MSDNMSDNIFDKFLLKLISVIHISLICFIVIVPFTNSNYLLMMHAMIVPFIIFHWVLNNNMCALTLVEKKLREKITGTKNAHKECLSCKIIEPIYDFKNNYKERAIFIYTVTIILWLISASKLWKKYKSGEIKKFVDLMKI